MSEFNHGKQTGLNITGNRSNPTSGEYNELIIDRIERQKRNEAKTEENNSKYGSGKYTDQGIIARIYGEYLVDISTLSKSDRTSFEYGYYDAADRQLKVLIRDKKVSDFIKASLDRKTKFQNDEEIGLYIKEVLYQIGYRDSYDKNIEIEKVSEIIKSNNDYFEGYMTGIEEQKISKGRQ